MKRSPNAGIENVSLLWFNYTDVLGRFVRNFATSIRVSHDWRCSLCSWMSLDACAFIHFCNCLSSTKLCVRTSQGQINLSITNRSGKIYFYLFSYITSVLSFETYPALWFNTLISREIKHKKILKTRNQRRRCFRVKRLTNTKASRRVFFLLSTTSGWLHMCSLNIVVGVRFVLINCV